MADVQLLQYKLLKVVQILSIGGNAGNAERALINAVDGYFAEKEAITLRPAEQKNDLVEYIY